MPKTGRNDPCPCGSGKKYKHCCLDKDRAAEFAPAVRQRVDLVHAGRLDDAEQAARELLVRYPEVHDGYDRLGMVHEARGEFRQAADCYRNVVEFARANPENYDPEFAASFLDLIAKLEASEAEAKRAHIAIDRSG